MCEISFLSCSGRNRGGGGLYSTEEYVPTQRKNQKCMNINTKLIRVLEQDVNQPGS